MGWLNQRLLHDVAIVKCGFTQPCRFRWSAAIFLDFLTACENSNHIEFQCGFTSPGNININDSRACAIKLIAACAAVYWAAGRFNTEKRLETAKKGLKSFTDHCNRCPLPMQQGLIHIKTGAVRKR